MSAVRHVALQPFEKEAVVTERGSERRPWSSTGHLRSHRPSGSRPIFIPFSYWSPWSNSRPTVIITAIRSPEPILRFKAEAMRTTWGGNQASQSPQHCVLPALQALTYAIQRSCVNKAEVVAADEREGGVRATLNLGHTFGHAIETVAGYGGPTRAACRMPPIGT